MRKIAALSHPLVLLAACGSPQSDAPAAPPRELAGAPAAVRAPAPVSGPILSKADLARQVCFFTPAEIRDKLGFAVAAGRSETSQLQGYGMASCAYSGPQNSLRVTVIWLDPGQVAASRASMTRMSGGGRIAMLPGDPDSAYLHDQQDNGTSLHYLRGNVRVQVQATSGAVPFATMKPRLLALRRVP